jgi:hypothetical protein
MQPPFAPLWLAMILGIVAGLFAERALSAAERTDPNWLLPAPELAADPSVPTLQDVLGYAWGKEISNHGQVERYLEALVDAAPDRARLVRYGKSYEGRDLYYLIITSRENLAQLDRIRANNLRLADPMGTSQEDAQTLIADAPALVWLAYSVHGDEISSTDAALLTAYHLLADRSSQTQTRLQQLVVFIDPLQNPDGRERFINVFRESRGRFSEPDPSAREHTQRWPGGRFNHYLFDMNRDWFLQTQRETQRKVAAYLKWQPHIYVDAHEMEHNATYFFPPPADPINPFLLPRQIEWLHRIGRHQAERFDRYGFPYSSREIFDAFYPGYGSEWPTLQGGIGMLWEQAGAQGLVIDRDDQTKLHYHDGVRHHYVSALATIELAAENRAQLVADFHEARRRGVQLGHEGPVKHYFLLEGTRPTRAFQLAKLLVNNGIQIQRTGPPLHLTSTDIRHARTQERTVPAGSYHIPVAQPTGRLVRALLDRNVDMDEQFVQRQLRRKKEHLPDEIYDVTAWSLPLAFDVDCLAVKDAQQVDSRPWNGNRSANHVVARKAKVAYLVSGDDDGAVFALARWLRSGLRVHVADQPLKLSDMSFPRGTLILRTSDNPQRLHDDVARAQEKFQLAIHATDTGFVTEGAQLGGPNVTWIRPPRIAMLVDQPTSYTVGHTWYLLDEVWRYPAARVAGGHLGRLDLSRYDVLIFPHGSYSEERAPSQGNVGRIKEWIERGGTLILVGGAAGWATGQKVQLLASRMEKKPVTPARSADETPSRPEESSAEKQDEGELPDAVPGAFLRAEVYEDHWVSFGVGTTLDVYCSGDLIFAPVTPNKGRNLVSFRAKEELLTSGFCWPQTLELVAGKPYVMYQPLGQGHIVAFSDDPNFRAMNRSLERLFFNAMMFGPGH